MDNITMKEILQAAVDYVANPNDEQAQQNFSKLKERLVVLEYIPLQKKRLLLEAAFLFLKTYENGGVDFALYKELTRVFFLLLGYVDNLDLASVVGFLSQEAYDVLQLSGLLNYIVGYCRDDFFNCYQMLDDMYRFEHLQSLMGIFSAVDTSSVKELTKAFESFKKILTPEFLLSLNNVLAINDPELERIRKATEEAAFKGLSTQK